MFDFNFYLSRIREGTEGRLLVTEKYYNKEHPASLFQIVYLLFGKVGGLMQLNPEVIYHSARILFGLVLLLVVGKICLRYFPKWSSVGVFLLIVTAGSWPILMKIGSGWRFGTFMGWWSVVDSLQRITFLPHVLIGQLFLVLFIMAYSKPVKYPVVWGLAGLIAGIIFPPTLIVVYAFFGVQSMLEIIQHISQGKSKEEKREWMKKWVREFLVPRSIFILCTVPSFIYLQMMFQVDPWKALALFDIRHRIVMPYAEYAMALGPILPLGLIGLIVILLQRKEKFYPFVSWILTVGLLFVVFENVPQQSPSRFTQAAIHIPLGILAGYVFVSLWTWASQLSRKKKILGKSIIGLGYTLMILMGLGVMASMVLWLTDQGRSKRTGTWVVPTGTQLIYPLKDFMDAIFYLRDYTSHNKVILAYETAGNFIPAYAGNYVYMGHANTPDEEYKKDQAGKFFEGLMKPEEAHKFLSDESIAYVYFGSQEKDLGKIQDLQAVYPFLKEIYQNSRVKIYQVN